MATTLNLINLNLFVKAMDGVASVAEGVKLSVDSEQTKILAKNPYARLKLTTNSLTSETPVEFCISDLLSLVKVLKIANSKLDDGDKVKVIIDNGFIKFTSKHFKSKFALCKEEVVLNYLDKEVTAQFNEVARFRTTVANIKELNQSSFIFNDPEVSRVFLFTDETNKGLLKAELNNRNNPFSNAMTVEFGQVLSGTLDKELILNYDRLRMFTLFDDVEDIELSLPEQAVINCRQKFEDGDEFVKAWIIISLMMD